LFRHTSTNSIKDFKADQNNNCYRINETAVELAVRNTQHRENERERERERYGRTFRVSVKSTEMEIAY
jgi:hypothetical protein